MIFELTVEEVQQVSGAGETGGRATGGRETDSKGDAPPPTKDNPD